ncbi:hypothetical protein PF005_g28287 [Phytophthora fragariae]|uniref:pectinesterase n=1 Tax=Phytophthora fragariae TaxID=53985 RepID=A0A6A3HH86_9STRA|nr:hypothetical protein PF003_g3802 [Phytophthora fragariae]KAE8920884.1 hypothetical protein PF009_g28827 [Phytophthora fragariae]KAE8968165.1 hypothetical protein PF011_g27280 [Phytophthora fragariae]KAE9066272.1 hypothetical protein PF010_g27872 [Phytophthora fragariae]KAE9066789.1 hypothetical protein PF007_g28308 [Phytophthora fragariae]
MQILAPLVVLAGLIAAVEGACSGPNARTQPPTDAIVVDATGAHNGSIRTVADGVAKLSNTTAGRTLFVFPGVYEEQVIIPMLNGSLVVQGYTCDTTSYAANEVTITHALAQGDIPASITRDRNDLITTLRLRTDNVKIYNLNVANMAGKFKKDGQALAVSVVGNNSGFYACNFTGYQDTLYENKGINLFAKTPISGAKDFIFGQTAKAWFESCDIVSVGAGCITANGRDSDANPSEYVFNNTRVSGTTRPGTAFLGRPWQSYTRVVWQNSELSDIIHPHGWKKWEVVNTTNLYIKEYNNSGDGAATANRAKFSGVLAQPVPITDVLGENYKTAWWVDTTFL